MLLDCQPGDDPCPGQDCDEINDVCIQQGTVVSAASRRQHTGRPDQDVAINYPASVEDEDVTSEPREGGIERLVIDFDTVPGTCGGGGGCLVVDYQPGGAGTHPGDESSWVPFAAVTVAFNSIVSNTLILDISDLDPCATYRFTVGDEVTGIADQSIQVRNLLGDMDDSGMTNAGDKGPLYGTIAGSGYSPKTDLNTDGVTNAGDKGPLYGTIAGDCNEAP